MKRNFAAIALAVSMVLSGCATVIAPVPLTRKLDNDMRVSISDIPVAITKNDGVVAAWTSAAYAPDGSYASVPTYAIPAGSGPLAAGVGGAIGQSIAVAIMDAVPSARARRSVEVLNADIDKAALDAALTERLINAAAASEIDFSSIDVVETKRRADPIDGQLSIKTRYALAEDASAVQVQATVEYYDSAVPYSTRYVFESKPPRSEMKGPHYRNTFTYHSDKFEAPELTDEVREALVFALGEEREARIRDIKDDYKQALKDGLSDRKLARVKKGSQKELSLAKKNHEKGLKSAEDDKLSKTEKAVLIIGQWRKGEQSSPLETALSEGQDFIAKMIVADFIDPTIPPMVLPTLPEKNKERLALIENRGIGILGLQYNKVLEDYGDRQVIQITSGLTSGAYHSIPASGTASYGNTFKVAE
jgi:hypothetical protein